MCCCYWPDSGSTKYGNVTVEVLSVAENRSYEGYKLRKFSLSVKVNVSMNQSVYFKSGCRIAHKVMYIG